MQYEQILKVTQNFYAIAKKDFLIGYHFRVIEDFEEHIPKIASFWQLQLTGKIENRSHLPFDLIDKHKVLRINKGELNRWVVLFYQVLEQSDLEDAQKSLWREKVEFFKAVLLKKLF